MSVLLSKAGAGQCRWIVCDAVDGSRDSFGGRRVCGAPVSWPTSYCAGHRLVVYERTVKAPGAPQDITLLRRQSEPEARPELTEMFG